MKAAIFLPVDYHIHNFMRALAVEIHQKYQTGLHAASFPPHITLKLPFRLSNLADLETYFDHFAASTSPLDIALTRLELQATVVGGAERGVLWLAVQESRDLRDLHYRINQELAERFEDTQAAYDGPNFEFHATLAVGGQPMEVYQRIYAEYKDISVNLRYTATQIGLAYCDCDAKEGLITYRILPLGEEE